MLKKQFSFFATQDDLVEVLAAVAAKTSYRFVSIDDTKGETPCIFQSVEDLGDVAIAVFGDQNREKSYLLIDIATTPKVRQVEQRRGGVNYILDQLSHPESVMFRPGGVFGEFECIIAGQVGTTSGDKWSADLYKILFAEFKKQFIKIKSFYVGKIAAKKLEGGVRLTTNAKSPPEYDLQY